MTGHPLLAAACFAIGVSSVAAFPKLPSKPAPAVTPVRRVAPLEASALKPAPAPLPPPELSEAEDASDLDVLDVTFEDLEEVEAESEGAELSELPLFSSLTKPEFIAMLEEAVDTVTFLVNDPTSSG